VLSALEEQNVIRKLAEPNLIAMSGETADFLAGGEFPVPVVSPGNGGLSTVTITYKEFGVKLSFTPTVLARGVISLKLVPEVSELDFADAVTISGFSIPALTTRRARTTVELRDGQSFAIAGLLQADSTHHQDQLPWLGSVPVLGALFRSAAYQANETELVVLVTPYLIKPVPPGKQLKTPLDSSLAGNDLDYFLNGQPEVPKTPPFTPNPSGGVQACLAASSRALPCLFRWPLPCRCLYPWPPLPCRCLFRYPSRLPFSKEMALSIMIQQPAISSIPRHMEVGSESRSHNLAPNALPDVFGVYSVPEPVPGARGHCHFQRRRCPRFQCGGPDPHALAALFERYDDRDGWRKNRPRGCTLQRRRKATASDCARYSAIRVHVWVRECILARVWRGGWSTARAGSRPRARAGDWAVTVLRPNEHRPGGIIEPSTADRAAAVAAPIRD
jgi:hypothetical protein